MSDRHGLVEPASAACHAECAVGVSAERAGVRVVAAEPVEISAVAGAVERSEANRPRRRGSHLNGLGIFAEVGEVLLMRIFTAPPDWRKIAFLLAGVLGLFLLGLVTMWWRGLL